MEDRVGKGAIDPPATNTFRKSVIKLVRGGRGSKVKVHGGGKSQGQTAAEWD